MQTALVRDDKYSRHQRREYKRVNENINKLWGEFTEEKLTSFELLSKVAKIYGPREDRNELEAEERQMN